MSAERRYVTLEVNGERRRVSVAEDTPLLTVLRNDLGLRAAKFGCGLEQCGACTVIVDGAAVTSCQTVAAALDGASIVTLEGLAARGDPLHAAFVEEHAGQCGYCIPGILVEARALLDRTPHPSDAEIREALASHLCRCGAHARILRAVRRVAQP